MKHMSDFHAWKIDACLKRLKTRAVGLSESEARRRILRHGFNDLPREEKASRLYLFFFQFYNPLIIILLVAGFGSLLLKDYIDAAVICLAVILDVAIGFVQEIRTSATLEKLKELVEHKTVVLREGGEKKIDSREIAVGDIIIIKAGNRVPADGRIIEERNLAVNESALTGESAAVEKTADAVAKGASLADRKNIVYSGTTVLKGYAKVLVFATATETEIGRIADLVKNEEEKDTPLQLKIVELGRYLGMFAVTMSALIILIGLIEGRPVYDMIMMGVAIAVSAIPEGLAIVVTVIMVIGMHQIYKQKALAKKLAAAETLGSVSVICTDKTGTLTKGEMQVENVIVGRSELKESLKEGSEQAAKDLNLALKIGMLCNDAVVENPHDNPSDWKILGGSTDSAIMATGLEFGLSLAEFFNKEKKVKELPFENAKKFMLVLYQAEGGAGYLYEKGAPEVLLAKSDKIYADGKARKMGAKDREAILEDFYRLSAKGLRIIGVAYSRYEPGDLAKYNFDNSLNLAEAEWEQLDKDLTFVGLITLKDPLRSEAKETIAICRHAGIRPVIITGDHLLTAKAIAEEIGLETKEKNLIDGEKLDRMDDKELLSKLGDLRVFARVTPHHKLRIINLFRQKGEVVAMTGDGINDAPALKAADIGISLGAGTDIAKESSDMILLDNNFGTIVAAVREGRIIFSNICKVTVYLISDSFAEIILIIGSIILGMPLPILPLQILWINIVKDGLPGFALAYEKGSQLVMDGTPLKKNAPIVSGRMAAIIFFVGIVRNLFIIAIYFYLSRKIGDIDYVRTVIFAILGVDSLIYIYSLKSLRKPIWQMDLFSNPILVASTLLSFFMIAIVIYWPPFQEIMSTRSLRYADWLIVLCSGLIGAAIIEMIKKYYRHPLFKIFR